jgi:excisionase family DNA binding protein
MLKIKIAATAKKKGLKSAYALGKALSISPSVAARLWKGKFEKIGINTIEALCDYLECQPNDLFENDSQSSKKSGLRKTRLRNTQSSKKSQSRNTQSRNTQSSKITQISNTELSNTDERYFSTKEVADKLGKKPRTVIDLFKSGKLPRIKRGQENFVSESDLKEYLDKII